MLVGASQPPPVPGAQVISASHPALGTTPDEVNANCKEPSAAIEVYATGASPTAISGTTCKLPSPISTVNISKVVLFTKTKVAVTTSPALSGKITT